MVLLSFYSWLIKFEGGPILFEAQIRNTRGGYRGHLSFLALSAIYHSVAVLYGATITDVIHSSSLLRSNITTSSPSHYSSSEFQIRGKVIIPAILFYVWFLIASFILSFEARCHFLTGLLPREQRIPEIVLF